jgi:hypothetical protein
MSEDAQSPSIPFIRKLCSSLSVQEVLAAEARFREFVEIVLRIHEQQRPAALKGLSDSTGHEYDSTIGS